MEKYYVRFVDELANEQEFEGYYTKEEKDNMIFNPNIEITAVVGPFSSLDIIDIENHVVKLQRKVTK